MDKSPDAFRTISEVAADLDLPQHVLRFWETRFVQIKPLKRGGGRRYYRPDDVELLKGIRHLLYGEGYTIRGVQRILKEQGVRFVMNVWQDGAPQPPAAGARAEGPAARPEPVYEDDGRDDEDVARSDETYAAYAPHRADPAFDSGQPSARDDFADLPENAYDEPDAAVDAGDPYRPPRAEPHFGPAATADDPGEDLAAQAMAQRFAPRPPAPAEAPPRMGGVTPLGTSRATPLMPPELRPVMPPEPHPVPPTEIAPPVASRPPEDDTPPDPLATRPSRLPAGLRPPEPVEAPRAGFGQFIDRLRSGGGRESTDAARGGHTLSRDEIRRLQSTLFELLECKRLLDQVR